MRIDRSISAVIAGVWLIAVFVFGGVHEDRSGPWDWIVLLAVTLTVLALIWFGDQLGAHTGGGRITHETPGCFVKLMGWIFLFDLIGWWLYKISVR